MQPTKSSVPSRPLYKRRTATPMATAMAMPVKDTTTLAAPDALAVPVDLAVPEEMTEALAVVMPAAGVATAVVITAGVVRGTEATDEGPAISLRMLELNVPVIPESVNIAEKASKGYCGVVGFLYDMLVNLIKYLLRLGPRVAGTVYVT